MQNSSTRPPLPPPDEHVAARPSWDCAVCGLAWPCPTARKHLTAQLGRVELAVLMWNQLEEAARDMPQTAASDLFTRFLRWPG